ncbi:DUF6812 domain-containing protein [Candidatus Venteria ishoeyi]|uniref:Uncharacterized protein n=1 Tax=Candidatus Venteria ishoeyi TaxID=1899563 RepID=A0A1H6FJY0_9GAMM|nr:hypothetical protein [Candidatus Venteria ishoeyi]MDM8548145.1 hypothetical protein [Candidatus Venteria ishoeyi]SEH09209.1 Uncharacterised protein [Candidatus Venteria ishoeyi]SEH09334.1 Uncharacterised protein [Candidatus Venteria ishoeyi]
MTGTIGTVSAWKKVPVRVELHDGTVLEGMFVIARDNRLSDFLNNPKKTFIALMDSKQVTHLLNKNHIVRATEIKS